MAETNPVIREWIAKAEGDWRMILLAKEQSGMEDGVMFHAQQCVEKYLKAALIACGASVQKAHDLVPLFVQLRELQGGWQIDLDDLDRLTQGGVTFRYPGVTATPEDAHFAVDLVSQVRHQLRSWLNSLPEATA
jgi:HEPN domain-containing protein